MPAVTVPVITQFPSPPIYNQITDPVVGSPFFAEAVLQRPGFASNVNAYGVAWSFQAIPPKIARKNGFLVTYSPALAQLVEVHSLADGALFAAQVMDVIYDGGVMEFVVGNPNFVGLWVFPGVEINLFWLV